jgi:tight adherence protein C
MKAVIDRLNLQAMIEAKDLKARLAQAGWKSKQAPLTFVFCKVALPVLFLVLGLFYAGVIFSHSPPMTRGLVIVLAMALGAYLPTLALANAIQKRQALLRKAFPDAMDLLVICVDAGLSMEGALNRVVEEMVQAAPDLAEELGLCTAELAFLSDRRVAWENLAERTGLPEIKTLSTTVIQSEKYGTPVSQGLKVLAQENREARMANAEKKAAALPAKLTVPMIIFFLPVLFMVIIGPAAIQVMQVMK